MPHAALWVVQQLSHSQRTGGDFMFQCRTRLCGWCNGKRQIAPWSRRCFNAARGFVGGAASIRGREPSLKARFNAARGVVGGAADEVDRDTIRALRRFNAARGFVGGAAMELLPSHLQIVMFQCRTRRCWWCSPEEGLKALEEMMFQCRTRRCWWCSGRGIFDLSQGGNVSMPHAALLVVQHPLRGMFA